MIFGKQFKEDSSFLREYLWKYRWYAGVGLMALIVVDGLEVLPPLILKHAVDSLVAGAETPALAGFAMVYLGITCVQAVGRYMWRAFLIRGSLWTGRDLRQRFAEYLFFLSASFYDRRRAGDLMSLATNDVEAVRMALGGGLVILGDAVFYFLTIPIAMFVLSPKLTFLAFLPLPLIPFIVLRQERRIHERFKKVQEAFSELSAMAQENLLGVRVVKAFSNERIQLERFKTAGEKYMQKSLSLARVQSVFGPDLDFLMSTGLVLLLWFGGADVIGGAVTVGTFVAFQKYIQKMIWPMEAIGLSIAFYQRAVASSNRIKEVLAEKTDVPESKEPRLPAHFGAGPARAYGRIEIKNLNFSYQTSTNLALKRINLTIEPGERVALVGTIGAGKSTLLSLLPRIYPTPEGTIFLDGVDINHWPLETLRRQIGFVSQDVFLFSENVRENIAFGLFENLPPEERTRRIEAAARLACVHEEVLGLSDDYDTRLGERGVNLSGGQKQRISIARALILEPPILILDDSLAAVDTKTELRLLENLKNRPGRNTELISAHRISTIRHSDRIVVLDRGEIVQEGHHEELIRVRSGHYRVFYEQQSLAEEIEHFT